MLTNQISSSKYSVKTKDPIAVALDLCLNYGSIRNIARFIMVGRMMTDKARRMTA